MPSGGDAPLGEQEAGSGPRREVAPGAVSLTPPPPLRLTPWRQPQWRQPTWRRQP